MKIEPIHKKDPIEALLMYPSLDLDIYVFMNIFDGVMLDGTNKVPEFSKRSATAHMLLVKSLMENQGENITISLNEDNFYKALKLGFIVKKNPIPVWKVKLGKHVGYGRNFAEAMCKLMICSRFSLVYE